MKIYNELQLAKELMRFPSITPVDAGTMNFLARKLRSLGFKCKILEFKSKNSKPVKNLYARLGKSRPNFCYAGHTDVVPPGNLNDWTVNPFKPAVKGNYLIGRGANDMKASVACFVAAVSKFKSKKFKGSISLLITGDEEGIAINGTKRVVEYLKRKKEKIDFCLVGEPTNQNKLGEMMKIGRRGSITGYLTVYGIQGHVAYPDKAKNPVPILLSFLSKLTDWHLDDGAPGFQPSNLEVTSLDVGNHAHNVIPARAEAKFNIRFNTHHTGAQLENEIAKFALAIDPDCQHIALDLKTTGEAFYTEPGPLTDMLQASVKEVTGTNAALTTGGGTSDARFIKDFCPVAELGLKNDTAHKVDEFTELAELEDLADIYTGVLRRYFAQS